MASFQRAIELDPGFAQAHAGLGEAYRAQAVMGFVLPSQAIARSRSPINTALALDDTLGTAHATAGWIALRFDWEWTRAEREFLRAIELNPGEPDGHDGLQAYYRSLGRFDDAIREGQEAIDLDPLNLGNKFSLAQTYTSAGRYEEALAQHRKVLELDPAHLLALWGASNDYIFLSRYDEAVELIERGMAIHGRLPILLRDLVWAYAAAGRKVEAEEFLAELHARDRDEYVEPTSFAVAYAALGDMDESFRWVDQALEDRSTLLSLPYWPGWHVLRGDPRFLDMLRRINYPEIAAFETAMQNAAAAKADRPIEKIAVLPFDDLMGDSEQEYFVDGMTVTLVEQLAKIDGVRVVSRRSAMRYRGTDESIPTIARELGVDALVEATVQRDGNTVRISARLIHGTTDERLWGDFFDGQLENILSLQSQIALQIAKEIQIAVSPEDAQQLLAQSPIDPRVLDAVMLGRFHWNKRTKEGFEQAAEQFRRAIDLDPNYAPAHAGLADTYSLQGYYGHIRPLEIMPLAKVAAERAIELDPASAQGFASLGRIVMDFVWDWEKAEEYYIRAIELDPDYPTAHHWYGSFLFGAMGRLDDGLAEASLAYRLDPLSPAISGIVAHAHSFRRDFAKAIEQYQHTLEIHPNSAESMRGIVFCHLYAGDHDSARPYLQRLRATPDDSAFASMVDARFLAAAGKKEEATRISVEALQKLDTTDFYSRMFLAVAFWEAGEDEKAFDLLTEAVKERATGPYLATNPWYDPMRGDPRFQALLDQINFPPLPPDHPVAILNHASGVARDKDAKDF